MRAESDHRVEETERSMVVKDDVCVASIRSKALPDFSTESLS
jgi:hypothetical protein